jgi:AraC-like DNA-binding protein
VLEQHPLLRTCDPEEMEAAIQKAYSGKILELPSGSNAFYGQANDVKLGSVGLTFCSYDVPVRLSFGGSEFVRQQIALKGSATTEIGNCRSLTSSKYSSVIPSNTELTTNFGERYQQIVVRIHVDELSRKVEALLGEGTSVNFDFELNVNFDSPEASSFRRLVLFLARELSEPRYPMPPTVFSEFEHAVAVSFLHATRHRFSPRLREPVRSVARWQVQLVEDYIEAHWKGPITVDELSKATGASARAIFKAFKESRGYSPMSYLKTVRLKEARKLLSEDDHLTSVTQIAFACGFVNLGHFAKDYRLAFGELPSETMRRR